MTKLPGILITLLCLAPALPGHAENGAESAQAIALPDWQALEYEQKAYWATAQSHLEVLPDPEDEGIWQLAVLSSVVSNSEQVEIAFDPATGDAISRARLSQGSGQRMKSYQYGEENVVRERRNQARGVPPEEWPVSSSKTIPYPATAADSVVTSPYLLILLAQRLQAQGLDKSQEVLVLTDQNFYRVRMTTGRGPAVEADYQVDGGSPVQGERETRAVAIQATPEGTLEDKEDFSLLGLQEDIIILFDAKSHLPLQVSGKAPRIGDTNISLKSVTMRPAKP